MNGLHYYRDAQAPESTTDGDESEPHEADYPPREPTPLAKAEAPRAGDLPQGPASSGDQAGRTQYHRTDTEPPPPPPVATEGKGLSKGKGLIAKGDARPDEGHADPRPRSRAGSYHSARSDLREERMLVLEQAMLKMQDTMLRINQALESGGVRPTELRGPPPKVRSDDVERPHDRQPTDGKSSPPQPGASSKYYPKLITAVAPDAPPDDPPDPPAGPKATTPSPAYQVPEEAVWNQSALSKALQMMKDTEITKLKFTAGSSRPLEYEKWMTLMGTTMNGHHPEIGAYWQRVVECAEKAYSSYIKDVSYTRIGIFPTEKTTTDNDRGAN